MGVKDWPRHIWNYLASRPDLKTKNTDLQSKLDTRHRDTEVVEEKYFTAETQRQTLDQQLTETQNQLAETQAAQQEAEQQAQGLESHLEETREARNALERENKKVRAHYTRLSIDAAISNQILYGTNIFGALTLHSRTLRIIRANPGISRFLDINPKDTIGKLLKDLVPEQHPFYEFVQHFTQHGREDLEIWKRYMYIPEEQQEPIPEFQTLNYNLELKYGFNQRLPVQITTMPVENTDDYVVMLFSFPRSVRAYPILSMLSPEKIEQIEFKMRPDKEILLPRKVAFETLLEYATTMMHPRVKSWNWELVHSVTSDGSKRLQTYLDFFERRLGNSMSHVNVPQQYAEFVAKYNPSATVKVKVPEKGLEIIGDILPEPT